MGRRAMRPGTWGAVRFQPRPDGRVRARAKFRELTGEYRDLGATGDTQAEAERLLRARGVAGQRDGIVLRPESSLRELERWWLAGLRLRDQVTSNTLKDYARDSRHVTALIGGLRLHELTVPLLEEVLLDLALDRPALANRARGALSRMLDDAVRAGVIAINIAKPTRTRRVRRPVPYTLTEPQAQLLRLEVREWLATRDRPGPSPDPGIVDIVDLLLVLGIRIGELLALRSCDIRLDGDRPSVRIGATIVDGPKGEPRWQDHPKAERQTRDLVLPEVAVHAFERHLRPDQPLAPVFAARNGNWLRPDNVRRIMHSFRDERAAQLEAAGIDHERVVPHLFRRTLATAIANRYGVDRAKEPLGHASIETTERHYVTPPRVVGQASAAMIDRLFGQRPGKEAESDLRGGLPSRRRAGG